MVSKMRATRRRAVDPAQDIQQSRLATARWAKEHDEFTRINIQIDVLQRANLVTARAVGLAQRTYLKNGRDLLADQWRFKTIQEVMAITAVFIIFVNGLVMDIKFTKT